MSDGLAGALGAMLMLALTKGIDWALGQPSRELESRKDLRAEVEALWKRSDEQDARIDALAKERDGYRHERDLYLVERDDARHERDEYKLRMAEQDAKIQLLTDRVAQLEAVIIGANLTIPPMRRTGDDPSGGEL